jgi:hypothetical protein
MLISPRPLRVHFDCHGANQLSSQSSRKVRFGLPGGGPFKAAGAALGQFHVTVYVTNPRSAHIATEAMLDRTLIAMSSDIDQSADTVTGQLLGLFNRSRKTLTRCPGDGALRFLKLTASILHWSYHSCGLARQGSVLI